MEGLGFRGFFFKCNDLSPQRQVCLLRGLHCNEVTTDSLPPKKTIVGDVSWSPQESTQEHTGHEEGVAQAQRSSCRTSAESSQACRRAFSKEVEVVEGPEVAASTSFARAETEGNESPAGTGEAGLIDSSEAI